MLEYILTKPGLEKSVKAGPAMRFLGTGVASCKDRLHGPGMNNDDRWTYEHQPVDEN